MIRRTRNAPLATFLLLLPLALLVRCKSDEKASSKPQDGPPVVQCTSADQCGLPPSTCSGSSLIYYTSPTCEGGYCAWQELNLGCSSSCTAGGCTAGTMTAGGGQQVPTCPGGSGGTAGDCASNAGNGGNGGGGTGGLDDDAGSLACDPDEDGGTNQCVP